MAFAIRTHPGERRDACAQGGVRQDRSVPVQFWIKILDRAMISQLKFVPVAIAAILALGGTAFAQQQQQQRPAQQRPPASAPAQGQSNYELPPVGTAIVVADVVTILRDAQAVQGIRTQIERQRNTYQAELQKQENELRNADQELAKQRSILSPEAFAQKRRELEKRVSDAQQSVQDRRRSLDTGFNTAMQKVNDAMIQVIGEIVQEKKYQIVMTKTQVVMVQTALDITPEVLRRLNRKLPTVAVSIPQN
ncbi:MAG TPA: OmpH family outer membrane protein [Alphaproteobacteria bacterium]|nr:OmpH family outer membrane protein [Alphaproteobacteria bacterium]